MQPDQIEALKAHSGSATPRSGSNTCGTSDNSSPANGRLHLRFPTPVTEVIGSQIGWTLLLGPSLVIAVVVGNVLGILAAWRRGGVIDSVVPPVLIFIGSFPYFWLAMGRCTCSA